MEKKEELSPRQSADLDTFPTNEHGQVTMVDAETERIQTLIRAISCHQKMLDRKGKNKKRGQV